MQFIQLLTSFKGRIGRGQWWLGFVALLVITFGGIIALNPGLFSAPVDQPLPPPSIAEVLWGLLTMIPATAITVKRFNDRDRPKWLGYAFGALGALMTVLPLLGLFVDPLVYSTPETVAMIAFGLLMLAAFIDNGFLRGTPGSNRYGPDPLAA